MVFFVIEVKLRPDRAVSWPSAGAGPPRPSKPSKASFSPPQVNE
jgi:hypothetical protein